jgi:hypothetical protein
LARDDVERGYERSRERNDAVRAQLEPLAAGERPLALTVSAAIALLIAAVNVGAVLGGVQVQGNRPVVGGILLAAVMAGIAIGLWQRRYLVLLLWQALLAVALVSASLGLMLASNLEAVILSLSVMGIAGTLFWKLVRVMARVQMPPQPPIG